MTMKLAGYNELEHVPGGRNGWPILGEFIPLTLNTIPYIQKQKELYGPVFRAKTPLGYSVIVVDPHVNKTILIDNAKITSNAGAWGPPLGKLFPNGLMLLDGEEHKSHRNIIMEAFKPKQMQGYLDDLPSILTSEFNTLIGKKEFNAVPFFKQLTLKIASKIFFGFDLQHDLTQINQAITDLVNASTALQVNLPFTQYRKGLQGRAFLVDYFKRILPERKASSGNDLFSRLCHATSENGQQLSDDEVIDHLIFILMASHDTTATTLTWMCYFLARYPEWQEKISSEAQSLYPTADLTLSSLRKLDSANLALKETLRMRPPLVLIPRYLTEELTINDITLPVGSAVHIIVQQTHQDEQVWTNPEQFDPERFSPNRKEQNRCPHAYIPFGAGPHYCIGFQFAEMSVKLAISMLVNQYELSLLDGYKSKSRVIPLNQPADKMPLNIRLR